MKNRVLGSTASENGKNEMYKGRKKGKKGQGWLEYRKERKDF